MKPSEPNTLPYAPVQAGRRRSFINFWGVGWGLLLGPWVVFSATAGAKQVLGGSGVFLIDFGLGGVCPVVIFVRSVLVLRSEGHTIVGGRTWGRATRLVSGFFTVTAMLATVSYLVGLVRG